MNYNLMGVVVSKRNENATKVQEVLTKYGCMIETRLGLHDSGDSCTNTGFIVLQLNGEKSELDNFKNELNNVPSVKAQYMTIEA